MSKENFTPGSYRLHEFSIESHDGSKKTDIQNLIHGFSIVESIRLGSIRGMATILDSINLFETFPIRGEETIILTYSDPFDNKLTHKLSLYALTDVEPNQKGDGTFYKIHYTDKSKFLSEYHTVSKSYSGKVSTIADNIFSEFYQSSLVTEETEGETKLIVPKYTPEEAMHFLTRRAYSSQNPSQTYRFYQNRNGYCFRPLDDIIRDTVKEVQRPNDTLLVKKYHWTSRPRYDGEGLLEKMREVVSLRIEERNDTLENFQNGAFGQHVLEIDLLKRSVNRIYNDFETFGENVPKLGKSFPKHSKGFGDDVGRTRNVSTTVLKDYPDINSQNSFGTRPQTFYGELIPAKNMTNAHYVSKTFMKVYGRNDLVAGDILELVAPSFGTDTEGNPVSKTVSGKYIVETVSNTFVEDQFMQDLTLIRNDWDGV